VAPRSGVLRIRRVIQVAAASVLLLLGTAAPGTADLAPDSLTPADVTVTAGVGAPSDPINATLHLTAAPPKADVILAVDTTGSMGSAIADAKADANAIVSRIKGAIPGARFAVVDFKDYPLAPFGDAGDYAYARKQALTSDASAVAAALNTMSAGGGNDGPEAYNRAIYESYSDAALGRDTTAPGFLVLLGDNLPHDATLNSDFASCPNTPPTDLGRDQAAAGDDLKTKAVLDGANAHHINVSMVEYNGTSFASCWSQLTTYTGGQQVTHTGSSSLADQIAAVIQEGAARVDDVTFTTSEGFGNWVSFDPELPYGPFDAPFDKPFTETITPPDGTEPGTYTFEVRAVADGATRAVQTLHVTVTNQVTNLEVTSEEQALPAGITAVPFNSIPASTVPALAGAQSAAGGSIAGGSIAGGSIAGGSIAGGSIPPSSLPGGSITFGQLGFRSTAGGSIAGGSIPGGSIPGGSIGLQQALQTVLLSQIPLTAPSRGATWEQVLAGTALSARPISTLTLYDVSQEPVAWKRLMDLSWRDVPLGTTRWAGVPLAAWLLGNAPLDQLPPPAPYTTWGAALNGSGGSAAGLDISQNTLFGVGIAGQLGRTAIGSIAGGSIAGGSIAGGSIAGGSIPAREILLSSINIAATRLADVQLVTITSLADIVNCSTSFACTGKTLGQAAAGGAIKPTATYGMLVDRVPSTSPARQMSISELIFGFLPMSLYPFEQLNVQGMQQFAGTGKNAHYHVDFDYECATSPTITSIAVNLPAGEFPVPGTTTFSFGGAPVAGADATSFDTDGSMWRATWTTIPGGACPTSVATPHVQMNFQAYERLVLGSHTAGAIVRAGGGTTSVGDQAEMQTTENREPDDDPTQATTIAKDTLYVGHVGKPGDQDVYRFPLSGLAPGTKIAAFLKVPGGTDFDMVLRKPEAPGVRSSAGGSIAGGSIPLEDPGAFVDNADRPLAPDTLADVPISTAGGSIPGGSIPGGSIAGGSIPGGSISANRGAATETAQIVTAGETADALIDVSGYLGAYSAEPYVLRLQVTPPPPLPNCPAVTGLNSAAAGSLPSPTSIPTTTKTLFLINKQRMIGLYGATAVNSLLGMTSPLNVSAARPEVSGVVLPVDGNAAVRSAYATWDTNPCSIDAVNGVVRKINDLVDTYRTRAPGIKYIVLLGPDPALPAWRQLDRAQISPEVDEAGELVAFTNSLAQPNALYGGAAQNHFLVDGAYGVRLKKTWLSRELPLPEDSVSRFVESPSEISNWLQQYIDTGGVLNPQTELTTGDEFFVDSAAAAHRALVAGFNGIGQNTLFPPSGQPGWDKQALLGALNPAMPDITALYAHYNPWLAQPSGPRPITNLNQLATTADIPGSRSLKGKIIFTIGCHSGLNIPDTYPGTASQKKDWAQSYNGAVYIANTGFGYDDTDSIALSGRLMWLFAQKLNRGSASIGEQWVDAVNSYYGSAGDWDVLDEKVMLQATFYGPPWARFQSPVPAPPPSTTTHADGNGLQVASVAMTPAVDLNTTADGESWWDVGDQTLSVQYRPIQPLATQDITVPGKHAHDPFITSLTVHDVPDIKPVRAYPVIRSSSYEPSANFKNIYWPAIPATVLESGLGATLNVIAGQFRPNPGDTELGRERLIDQIGVDIAYTTAPRDGVVPLITEVGAVMSGSDATIFVHATDASGPINKVVALYNDGGPNNFQFVQLTHVSGDLYTAVVHGLVAPPEIIAQVRGADGDVGFSANKAVNFTALVDNTAPDISIVSPLDGGVYTLGQSARADYSCADNGGVQTCDGTVPDGAQINTGSFGTKTFEVTATDIKGNTTTVTRQYTVVQRSILFASSRTGNGDIYMIGADGETPTQLTSGSSVDTEPDWFPSTSKIAFASTRNGGLDIYTMNVDGTNLKRLTTDAAIDTSPAVSPDGKKIAFASNRNKNWDIYVMNADTGGELVRLTSDAKDDNLPAWSSDGSSIAFASLRSGNWDIFTMPAAGGTQTQRTTFTGVDTEPAWYGSTIAFSSKRGSNFDIYKMPAAGGAETQLTTQGIGDDVTPAWSPDGTAIVFASNRSPGAINFDIYTMSADGTDQTLVATHPLSDTYPEW
jgi:Tol biopolymer transport system component